MQYLSSGQMAHVYAEIYGIIFCVNDDPEVDLLYINICIRDTSLLLYCYFSVACASWHLCTENVFVCETLGAPFVAHLLLVLLC